MGILPSSSILLLKFRNMRNHALFFARTVLVKNGLVDAAYRSLDRILKNEKIQELWRRNMYYEKPYQTRQRLSYEKCKRVYNADMRKKVEFLMKKNRVDPWLR